MTMRAIVGFDGYSVTADGRVFSHKSRRFLAPQLASSGYLYVGLQRAGKAHNRFVHRLVLQGFSPIPDDASLQCNHIDGDKLHNSVSNLEWATPSENRSHSHHILGNKAPIMRGANNPLARAVVRIGSDGSEVRYEAMSLARTEGFTPSGICSACSGVQRTHRGYRWRYAEAAAFAAAAKQVEHGGLVR